MTDKPNRKKIQPINLVYVMANPVRSGHLRLQEENRVLGQRLVISQEELRRAGIKPIPMNVQLFTAATRQDLMRAVGMTEDMVLISMHGAGEPGLVLGDEQGNVSLLPPDHFTKIMGGSNVRALILSACHTFAHSENLVEAARRGVRGLPEVIVGTKKEVSDPGAAAFSQALASMLINPRVPFGTAYDRAVIAGEEFAPGIGEIITLYQTSDEIDPYSLYLRGAPTEKGPGMRSGPGDEDNSPVEIVLNTMSEDGERVVDSRNVAITGSDSEPVQQRGGYSGCGRDRSGQSDERSYQPRSER